MKNTTSLIAFLLCCTIAFSQGGIKGEWLAIKDDLIFDFSDGDSLAIVQFNNRDDASKWKYFPIEIEGNQIKVLSEDEVFETMQIVGRGEMDLRVYDPSWEEEFHLVRRKMFDEAEISHFFSEDRAIEVSYRHPELDTIVKEVFYTAGLINGKTHDYCAISYNYELERMEPGLLFFLNWNLIFRSFLRGKYLIEEVKKDGFNAISIKNGERVFVTSKYVEKPVKINLENFLGNYVMTPYDQHEKNKGESNPNVHTIHIGYSSLRFNGDGTFILDDKEWGRNVTGAWELYFFDGDITLILSAEDEGGAIYSKNYLLKQEPNGEVVWNLKECCVSRTEGIWGRDFLPSSVYLEKKE